MGKAPNYWDYIRVEELLALQRGLAESEAELSNDEVLFIAVHQIYELWFKLVRRELTSLRDFFDQEEVPDQAMAEAVRSLKRVTTLLRQCVAHFEVIETLTTRAYLAFRDKLMPASGFQSAQMRQIEILMGLDEAQRIELAPGETYLEALRDHEGGESTATRRVRRQLEDRPSLIEAIEAWLYRTPIDGAGPEDTRGLERFVEAYTRAHGREVERTLELALERARRDEHRAAIRERYESERRGMQEFLTADGDARRRRIRAAVLFILSYRELPLLAWPRDVVDGLIEMEQVFVLFRQRHARMVERVIGRRTGTGSSSGVEYLDQTALRYRVFRDLWAARTWQIPRSALPELENPRFYDFRNA